MHRGNGNYNAILEACSSKVVCNLSQVGEKLATVKMVKGLTARIMVQFQKNGQPLPPAGRFKVDLVRIGDTQAFRSAKMIGNWYVIEIPAADVDDFAEEAHPAYAINITYGPSGSTKTLYAGTGDVDVSTLSPAEEEAES